MAILPNKIIAEIEKTSNYITDNLNYELWDDAACMLVQSLRIKANRKYRLNIAGTKMVADVQARLCQSSRNDRYCVVRRESV